jgi:hypothetical protein
VSCCGLEDLNQLAKKFGAAADLVLGKLWRQSAKLQLLLALPPGKRNSRMHLPEVRPSLLPWSIRHCAVLCLTASMRGDSMPAVTRMACACLCVLWVRLLHWVLQPWTRKLQQPRECCGVCDV